MLLRSLSFGIVRTPSFKTRSALFEKNPRNFKNIFSLKPYEVTIHTLPHLKCIRLVSVRSSLHSTHIGVRIELT